MALQPHIEVGLEVLSSIYVNEHPKRFWVLSKDSDDIIWVDSNNKNNTWRWLRKHTVESLQGRWVKNDGKLVMVEDINCWITRRIFKLKPKQGRLYFVGKQTWIVDNTTSRIKFKLFDNQQNLPDNSSFYKPVYWEKEYDWIVHEASVTDLAQTCLYRGHFGLFEEICPPQLRLVHVVVHALCYIDLHGTTLINQMIELIGSFVCKKSMVSTDRQKLNEVERSMRYHGIPQQELMENRHSWWSCGRYFKNQHQLFRHLEKIKGPPEFWNIP
eukprot:UN27777